MAYCLLIFVKLRILGWFLYWQIGVKIKLVTSFFNLLPGLFVLFIHQKEG
jgi:hypothetical protein